MRRRDYAYSNNGTLKTFGHHCFFTKLHPSIDSPSASQFLLFRRPAPKAQTALPSPLIPVRRQEPRGRSHLETIRVL
jgi:hypothetical protein